MSLSDKAQLIELVEKIMDEDPSDFSMTTNGKKYKLTLETPDSWSSSSDTKMIIEISEDWD